MNPRYERWRWQTFGITWLIYAGLYFTRHSFGVAKVAFAADPRVLMVSTFQYPLYPYSGVDNPAPNMVNVPLSAGSGSAESWTGARRRCSGW